MSGIPDGGGKDYKISVSAYRHLELQLKKLKDVVKFSRGLMETDGVCPKCGKLERDELHFHKDCPLADIEIVFEPVPVQNKSSAELGLINIDKKTAESLGKRIKPKPTQPTYYIVVYQGGHQLFYNYGAWVKFKYDHDLPGWMEITVSYRDSNSVDKISKFTGFGLTWKEISEK